MITTQIMGVLNVTPDSFYDGGRYFSTDKAVQQGLKLIDQGADILDIGGESTRPPQIYAKDRGPSLEVSAEEEAARVIPVIEKIREHSNTIISIDTRKAKVAEMAIQAGANLINDVTGLTCPDMIALAADYEVPVCTMHMQGSFQTMQDNPSYEPDVITYLLHWFDQRIKQLVDGGIKEKNIILDPGICFGKTLEHNFEILKNIDAFKQFGCKLLVGASRKSFLKKVIGKNTDFLLPGTLGISTYLMIKGIDIIRVHDVEEHMDIKKALSPIIEETNVTTEVLRQ